MDGAVAVHDVSGIPGLSLTILRDQPARTAIPLPLDPLPTPGRDWALVVEVKP